MKKESLISYKEFKSIIIISLILALIFGFNDNKPSFIFKDWFKNLFYIFILSLIIVLVNSIGYKLMARYLDANIEIKIWNSQFFSEKFNFFKVHKYLFTPVLAVLTTLFSNGKLFFTALSTFEIKNYSVYGRRFPKLTYFNLGLITIGGLFFNFILMLFFKMLLINKGVLISAWFILWNLLPFSELPGARIFLASKTMYFFSLIFFAANILLIQSMPILTAIIVSLFFSIVLAVVYFYFMEYLKS